MLDINCGFGCSAVAAILTGNYWAGVEPLMAEGRKPWDFDFPTFVAKEISAHAESLQYFKDYLVGTYFRIKKTIGATTGFFSQ